MRIIRQHLVRHRINVLSGLVLRDVQPDQIRAFQRRSVHGVRPMLLDPGENIRDVEDGARLRTYRVRIWLQRERTEIEG